LQQQKKNKININFNHNKLSQRSGKLIVKSVLAQKPVCIANDVLVKSLLKISKFKSFSFVASKWEISKKISPLFSCIVSKVKLGKIKLGKLTKKAHSEKKISKAETSAISEKNIKVDDDFVK
jgi:hypothetical protein